MVLSRPLDYTGPIVGERRAGSTRGTPSDRGRVRALSDQDALVASGLLPDIDFCTHALELSTRGRLVGAEHRATCAVCHRRWRVEEARLQPWRPMVHERAAALIPDMAAAFTSDGRAGHYRSFYAHVARCADCERRLAELTFAQTLPAPKHTPLAVRR